VPALSPTLYLDVSLPPGGRMTLAVLAAELAVYPVTSSLQVDGIEVAERTMAVLQAETAELFAPDGARLAVVGGAALDGPRHMWWNFVSTRQERILQAAADWEAQRMDGVPGDEEFIPLPPTRFTPPEPKS